MSESERDPKLSMTDEAWLDRVLRTAAPIEPSAAVRRAVAEIPLRHPRPAAAAEHASGLAGWPARVLRFAMLTAVASVAVGAWLGYEANVLPSVAFDVQARAAAPQDAENAEDAWEELALLAFAAELDEELAP